MKHPSGGQTRCRRRGGGRGLRAATASWPGVDRLRARRCGWRPAPPRRGAQGHAEGDGDQGAREQSQCSEGGPPGRAREAVRASCFVVEYVHEIKFWNKTKALELLALHLGLLEKDQAGRKVVDVPAFTLSGDTPG